VKHFPVLFAVVGCFPVPALAAELIVVEDRGGASALPYYEALDSPKDQALPPVPAIPSIRSASEAEAALLPVRSTMLSPGEDPPPALHAPGLMPIFLIGDDDLSRAWLRERYSALRDMRAVGFAVNVSTPASLAALRRLVPELSLSPVSGDDRAVKPGRGRSRPWPVRKPSRFYCAQRWSYIPSRSARSPRSSVWRPRGRSR
jgi:integrating conjugative element protein (TIGR03765 family)